MPALVLAAVVLHAAHVDLSRDGWIIAVDSEPEAVDVARDFFVTLTMTAPDGRVIDTPDLRDRFRGFRVAEDFSEEQVRSDEGRTTGVFRWRLVPEPVAKKYALRPFVVDTFWTAPVPFTPPALREAVTGGMETDPHKDLPPFSWRLAGFLAAGFALAVVLVWGIALLVRKIATAVKVHRMSPIQRAYWELDRLIERGLPARGLFKDFYVELTMVVRRYIERRYGVKAPKLTTEEFLRAAGDHASFPTASLAELKTFLESADLVKFAGVEATPEMTDGATDRARGYLNADGAEGGAAS